MTDYEPEYDNTREDPIWLEDKSDIRRKGVLKTKASIVALLGEAAFDNEYNFYMIECPTCGHVYAISMLVLGDGDKPDYCPNCGQPYEPFPSDPEQLAEAIREEYHGRENEERMDALLTTLTNMAKK